RESSIRSAVTEFILVPAGVLLLFGGAYFAELTPPVPISIQYMGIYHDVSRVDGQYQLSYNRPFWKFWQNGDQTFLYTEGDRVFCFARIFSPGRFADKVIFVWEYAHPKNGWQVTDRIPIP